MSIKKVWAIMRLEGELLRTLALFSEIVAALRAGEESSVAEAVIPCIETSAGRGWLMDEAQAIGKGCVEHGGQTLGWAAREAASALRESIASLSHVAEAVDESVGKELSYNHADFVPIDRKATARQVLIGEILVAYEAAVVVYEHERAAASEAIAQLLG